MVRAQRSGHLETLLTWHFREETPKFRDMSWEADTVFALGTETERWRNGGYRGIKGLGNLETQLNNFLALAPEVLKTSRAHCLFPFLRMYVD